MKKTLAFCLTLVVPAFLSAVALAQITPISDIQTGVVGSGATVTVSGIVSLVYPPYSHGGIWHMDYFIADGTGAEKGIYVYRSQWGPRIGDQVTLTGTVAVSNGQKRIADPTAFNVDSSGNTPYGPVTITADQILDPRYQSCLVRIENLTVSNEHTGSAGRVRWQVSNTDGTVTINDELDYNYFPKNGDQFDSITGIVERNTSRSPNQWLEPRFTNDLEAAADILPHYALYGTVVTMDDERSIHTNYYVTVRGDQIVGVSADPPGGGVEVIDTGGLIFPALINNHDHPSKGIWGLIPFPKMEEYRCLADWAGPIADDMTKQMYRDFRFQTEGEITSSLTDAYAIAKIGEVRMASSGTVVTQGQGRSTSHYNDKLTKLGVGIINGQRFPGRSIDVVFAHSEGPAFWAARHQEAERGVLDRYFIHLAQSRTQAAGGCEWKEWDDWSSWSSFDGRDVIIHGNSLRGDDFAGWGAHPDGRQTHLSWVCYCNMVYYGSTADIPSALAHGANVTIGTDATAWGKPNLLAELNYCKHFSDQSGWSIQTRQFIEMVTRNPAKSFGRLHDMGTVEEGKMANLMVIADGPGDPYDDLLMVAGGGADPDYDCGPKDVRLTVCAGRPIYGDPDLLNTTNFPFLWEGFVEDLTICGVTKKLSIARYNSPNLEGVDDLFSKFYLEWWGKYYEGGRYPSDFVSVDPAGVLPPIPARSPTPPPGTYVLTTWRDDAQQHSTYYDQYGQYGYIHIGRHTPAAGYDTGFRFNDIDIPPGRVIQDARLVLTQFTSLNTAEPKVQLAADAIDDSPVFFLEDDGPLYRPLTGAKVDWTIPAAPANSELTSPDISGVIQAIVDRPGWEEGNSITILVVADEPAADKRRRIWSWHGDKTKAARLVIQADATPVPEPTPAICTLVDEGFDGFVAPGWEIPAGWEFSGIGAGDVFTTAGEFGRASPSLRFDANGNYVITPAFASGEWLQFWVKGQGVDATSGVLIEEEYYAGWGQVASIQPIPSGGRLYTGLPLHPTTTRVRFTFEKSAGEMALDDVMVKCGITPTPTPLGYKTPTPAPTAKPTVPPTPAPTIPPSPVPTVPPTTTPPPPASPSPSPACSPCAVTVEGYVYDSVSSLPLEAARIDLDWKDRCWESQVTTFSSSTGYYKTTQVPAHTVGDGLITVSFAGYQTDNYDFTECGDHYRDFYLVPLAAPSPTAPPAAPWITDYNGDGTSDIAIYRSASGLWAVRGVTRVYFGGGDDVPVPGDYSGDGTTDIAIFRESTGLWAIRDGARSYFGTIGDLPIPGDYSGDGTADIGIYRETSGLWVVRDVTRVYFGGGQDEPVPGYYTADGKKSVGIYRPASGLWAIRDVTRVYFGGGQDEPVPGDYEGDGFWSPAIFRPSSGLWAVRDGMRVYFGQSTDEPILGGFRGDGQDYPGIFRPTSGLWAIRGVTRVYFGAGTDRPVSR